MAGLRLPEHSREEAEESLQELQSLGEASGARIVGSALQSRARVDGRTFLGAGKAEELKEMAEELGANLILVDHDLSPVQGRNLEKITDLKILDRTELILDIFANRARTPQARLQVEVAQLEYLMPRLTRLWSHLGRTGGGIGTRGPGETQLEVDRRRIRTRLASLKKRLATTGQQLETRRNLGSGVFRIALVGYTNAGKSSLMNQLTDAGVDSHNRLFETLDATTRILDLGSGFNATMTDTVGFVRRLPHSLVESFRATLSEVASADLLLHVHDSASARLDVCRDSVLSVLHEIGASDLPQIQVYNKADLLDEGQAQAIRLKAGVEDGIVTSTVTKDGLDELREAIRSRLRVGWVEAHGIVPLAEGEVLAKIRAVSEVLEEHSSSLGVEIRIRVAPAEWARLRSRFAPRAPGLFEPAAGSAAGAPPGLQPPVA